MLAFFMPGPFELLIIAVLVAPIVLGIIAVFFFFAQIANRQTSCQPVALVSGYTRVTDF
jgi:hypothetical protein